jgi:hypothetical protein
MTRVLMTSSFVRIFAGVSLTLVLYASSSAPAHAATPTKPGSNLIRVWIVGSPHTNSLPRAVVPAELRQRAESLGYTVEVEAFRPDGFAAHFHQALQSHTEPEILTFDNYGVIIGMNTKLGWFQGIDWDRRTASSLALVHETMSSLQPRGWVMLVRSAINYEAARTLAMRPPECDPRSGLPANPATIEPTLRYVQQKAVFATRAYLDCDQSTLATISDESRMVQQCFQPQSDTKAESIIACSVSGNDKLAFVTLAGGFSSVVRDPRALAPSKQGIDLGQRSLLAVLTNQSGTWKLLAITHDPVNTVARIPAPMNTLINALDKTLATAITPEPARLLTPNGVYPAPQRGERFGDFIWEPSQSSDVIGQVAEFMWGKETNWGLTRLFFLPPNVNKQSTGGLMLGGTTMWRVWSISKSGDIAFSEQQSFKFCPCPSICRDWL